TDAPATVTMSSATAAIASAAGSECGWFMADLLQAGEAADRSRPASLDDGDRGARAAREDRVAGDADRVHTEHGLLPAEHASRLCRWRTVARVGPRRASLAARRARDARGVGDHLLHEPEGVLQHVAHQVRDRNPESRRPFADLLLQAF